MKKIFLVLLLSLLFLTSCNSDVQNKDTQMVETEKEIPFSSKGCIFVAVNEQLFTDSFETDGQIIGIAKSDLEWIAWAKENMPNENEEINSKLEDMNWKEDCLLVYQSNRISENISEIQFIEKLVIKDDVLSVVVSSDIENRKVIENNSVEGTYYIPYVIVQIKKAELPEELLKQYELACQEITNLEFKATELILHEINTETFVSEEGIILGIATSEEEWTAWADENLYEWKNNRVLNGYQEVYWENNYLLIYSCEKDQEGYNAVKYLLNDDENIIVVEEQEIENGTVIVNETQDKAYIAYQFLWISKDELQEEMLNKYLLN